MGVARTSASLLSTGLTDLHSVHAGSCTAATRLCWPRRVDRHGQEVGAVTQTDARLDAHALPRPVPLDGTASIAWGRSTEGLRDDDGKTRGRDSGHGHLLLSFRNPCGRCVVAGRSLPLEHAETLRDRPPYGARIMHSSRRAPGCGCLRMGTRCSSGVALLMLTAKWPLRQSTTHSCGLPAALARLALLVRLARTDHAA
jgi:hypothetical protein